METWPIRQKYGPSVPVSSLPMRDGNMNRVELYDAIADSLKPSYEGWKRDIKNPCRSGGDVSSLPMRDGNPELPVHPARARGSLKPSYEGWKPVPFPSTR